MAKVTARKETGRLVIDFFFRGVRCREQTALADNAANRKLLLFRVVGYLPGTGAQAMIAHDLRAGVAQASGEETAENANAGVQGANSMGIRAAVWRPKLAGKRRQCAIALGRGLAQLRWRALRRKCPELWSAARSAGHAPTPPRSPSASTSKTSGGSGACS